MAAAHLQATRPAAGRADRPTLLARTTTPEFHRYWKHEYLPQEEARFNPIRGADDTPRESALSMYRCVVKLDAKERGETLSFDELASV